MKRYLLLLILWCVCGPSAALQPIPVDQAFQHTATVKGPTTVLQQWQITPGYYLYRDHITLKVLAPAGATVSFDLPPGIEKQDEFLGRYEVYQDQLSLPVTLHHFAGGKLSLAVSYQGCSAAGFCYPPITKNLTLDLPAGAAKPTASDSPMPTSPQGHIEQILLGKHLPLILATFFGFGLLLSFTPCILPMIPILSGLIVGQGNITTFRAFQLSLAYVLGMAVTYAIAGVITGYAGSYVQASLQQPWVIAGLSGLFIVLALSLFGLFELRMPHAIHQRVTHLSNRQQGGSIIGVAIMGILSTLIVSPCVTAPLVGTLSYIAQSGNAVLGGSALFAMGLGMGVPLLAIGTLGEKLLPKKGAWMHKVKEFFGIVMLALAIWMLSRVLPGPLVLMLWAALSVVTANYLGVFSKQSRTTIVKLWQGLGYVLLCYGVILIVGAALGNTNPLHPLANVSTRSDHRLQAENRPTASNLQELTQQLDVHSRRPVILDFYADWCISCKHLERYVFTNPRVNHWLKNRFTLIKVDVTRNGKAQAALLKRYQVIAPPTLIFLDAHNREIANSRIVGEITAKRLEKHLMKLSSTESISAKKH